MAKDEITLQDLIIKHNELCEYLDELQLNPLADFYSLKVDIDEDSEELVDIEEVEEDAKATFG